MYCLRVLSCYERISIDFTIDSKIISQLCETFFRENTSERDVDPGESNIHSIDIEVSVPIILVGGIRVR